MYNHAVADGFLPAAENPAARVPKPRRPPASRMALPDGRLAEISAVAASTGDDPALDALIIRLHSETACRRGGALALTPEDLDPGHCLIRLREKGGTERWQPVSPTLMTHLLAHAESRGGLDSGERLLRYATGKPITARRYDYLWNRLGEHLPWVKTQQVSTHWIRHTILTWVERRFGFAVAQAYAGHQDAARGARAMSATGTYVRAGLPEVATALAVLTGESHPLAPEGAHVGAVGPTRCPNGTDHLCKLLDLEGSAEDRRRTMDQIKVIRQHLTDAKGVSGVLSAGWRAFEFVRAVTGASAGQAADMYPAFTFARGAAVSGRNAVACAPSLPADCAPYPGISGPAVTNVHEVADAVAELASVLSGRLREAARIAAEAGDRVACESAASDAEQISRLLTKGE
jgi:hypothetical protein